MKIGKERWKMNSCASRYLLLLGCNFLFVLGYVGCVFLDIRSHVEILGLSGIYLLVGFPLYAILHGIFSNCITKKIIFPQVFCWVFFNFIFLIALLLGNRELSILEEMIEFSIFTGILIGISALFALLTKLVHQHIAKQNTKTDNTV